jgi:hypothetical protein
MTASFSFRFLLPAALLLVALALFFLIGNLHGKIEAAFFRYQRQRHRPAPGADEGMLFLWPGEAPRERAFWMRATPASLDILYLGQDGRILSIAAETQPNSDKLIPSRGPAHGVLELRAGRAAELGAKAGDKVLHPYFAE